MHTTDFQPTYLVVVDGIDCKRVALGKITTFGGRLRIWQNWTPLEEDLAARKFAYSLPLE